MSDICIVTPDLGSTTILSSILKNHNLEVKNLYVDIWREGPLYEKYKFEGRKIDDGILNFIKKENPKLIGIFSRVHPSERLLEQLKMLKTPMVYKGPKVHDLFKYYQRNNFNFYDYGIDGSLSDFPSFARSIISYEKHVKNIDGLTYFSENKIVQNKPIWSKSYFTENKPDFKSVYSVEEDGNIKYDHPNHFWIPYNLGCPYKCEFCKLHIENVCFDSKEVADMIENAVNQSEKITSIGLVTQTPKNIDKVTDEISKRNIKIKELTFWSRADLLLKNYKDIENAVNQSDFYLNVGCIGFESFIQSDLDYLGKCITVKQNIETVNMIRNLNKKNEKFEYKNPNPHGLILFSPWTNVKSLRENYKVINKYKMWDIFNAFSLSNKLGVPEFNDIRELLFQNSNNVNIRGAKYDGKVYWEYKSDEMLHARKIADEYCEELIKLKRNSPSFEDATIELSKQMISDMNIFLSREHRL